MTILFLIFSTSCSHKTNNEIIYKYVDNKIDINLKPIEECLYENVNNNLSSVRFTKNKSEESVCYCIDETNAYDLIGSGITLKGCLKTLSDFSNLTICDNNNINCIKSEKINK